jgi:hypothetical protein
MFTKILKVFMYTTLLLSLYSKGNAYPQYNGNVPNGNMIPPSAIELGHPGGATKRYTLFANAYVSNGRKWTRGLCTSDSDGDGQSNGLEMGDPCCTWTVGAAPVFTSDLSDPNNPASTTKRTNQTCQ